MVLCSIQVKCGTCGRAGAGRSSGLVWQVLRAGVAGPQGWGGGSSGLGGRSSGLGWQVLRAGVAGPQGWGGRSSGLGWQVLRAGVAGPQG